MQHFGSRHRAYKLTLLSALGQQSSAVISNLKETILALVDCMYIILKLEDLPIAFMIAVSSLGSLESLRPPRHSTPAVPNLPLQRSDTSPQVLIRLVFI